MASTGQHPVLRKGGGWRGGESDRDTVNIKRGSTGKIVAMDGSTREI